MAVRFDAANDQLGRTTDLPDYNGVYTWMGHFYLTADTNATGAAMVITNADGTSYDFIGVTSDGTSLVVDGGASGVNVQALSLGTWYTIAMVRSSDTSLIGYCYDGATLNSGTDTVDVSARGALTSMVTGGALGTYLWNGRTSCQKLWNRALTSAEILNEARTIRVQDATSLYAWWPMFAGSAEYIKDYSGNGRDFTAGGTLTEEQDPPLSWGAPVILNPYATAGQTISIGVGTLSIGGSAPSLGLSLPISFAGLVVVGSAPSLALNTPIQIGAGSVTASGFSLTLNQLIEVSTGVVNVVGSSPSLNQAWLLEVGSFDLSGLSLSLVQSVLLPIGSGDISTTGFSLALLQSISVDAGSIAISGLPISFNQSWALDLGSFNFTGLSPTISQSVLLPIATGSVTVDGYAISQSQQMLLGSVSSVVVDGYVPTPTFGAQTISIGTGPMNLSGLLPSVITSSIGIEVGGMSISGFSASIAEQLVVGGTVDVLASGLVPSLDSTLPISVGSFETSGYIPSLQTSISNVQIGVGTLSLDGYTPLLVTGFPTLDIGMGSLVVSGLSPTIQQLLLIRNTVNRSDSSLTSKQSDSSLTSKRADNSLNSKRTST